jgi:hypothetical protein
MLHKEKNFSLSTAILMLTVLANALVVKAAFVHNSKWYWLMFVTLPLLGIVKHLGKERQH